MSTTNDAEDGNGLQNADKTKDVYPASGSHFDRGDSVSRIKDAKLRFPFRLGFSLKFSCEPLSRSSYGYCFADRKSRTNIFLPVLSSAVEFVELAVAVVIPEEGAFPAKN